MLFIADFHVHSHYSRATARSLSLETLHAAAQLKGVQVVGTGDATHPGWLEQIKDKLLPAEPGLYRLRPELAKAVDSKVPPACHAEVRFLLVAEISNIYRRAGRTRKNHNLVFLPDVPSTENLCARLARIGNIHADGRPILGLDTRDLLELLLEVQPTAFLVPAHIWTPWFSLFGSRSGFDAIEECFGDLSAEIVAVETGLSSDPPMNWRVSALDRLTLLSNSDAHSPMKLGREANLFDTEMSFAEIYAAIRSRDPARFKGTFEFYPEEGKYHLDGHRKCGLCQIPSQTRAAGELCPRCGKPLTLGVLHRVEQLADRPQGYRPAAAAPFTNLIPLAEILAELVDSGPESQRVQRVYRKLLERLGPELKILNDCPLEQIDTVQVPLLAEAIKRMRQGLVRLHAGFDGEYGRVRVFDDGERRELLGQQQLFHRPLPQPAAPAESAEQPQADGCLTTPCSADPAAPPAGAAPGRDGALNAQQRLAVGTDQRPLLVKAGPGTGKTHTLTHAIAHCLLTTGMPAEAILALTFTQRAAAEMRERLARLLPAGARLPLVGTFHAVCRTLLAEQGTFQATIAEERECLDAAAAALALEGEERDTTGWTPSNLLHAIGRAKQSLLGPGDDLRSLFPDLSAAQRRGFGALYAAYERILTMQARCDFDTLIFTMARCLAGDLQFRRRLRQRFRRIFIDEYQDLNQAQHHVLLQLSSPSCPPVAIGDPDQSIYGFRGCDPTYFDRFQRDYPDAIQIALWRNYRSSDTILRAARQVLGGAGLEGGATTLSGIHGYPVLTMLEASNERQEAAAISRCITRLVGGSGYHSRDADGIEPDEAHGCTYGDIAVLYRLRQQSDLLRQQFDRDGIPWQLAGKEALSSQPHVADQLAVLRLMEGCAGFADLECAARRLSPGVGKRVLANFTRYCLRNNLQVALALEQARRLPLTGVRLQDQKQLYRLLQAIDALRDSMRGLRVTDRLQRIQQRMAVSADEPPVAPTVQEALARLAAEAQDDARAFLSAVSQQFDGDWYCARAQRVALMTMHASKGLEFQVVLICGCEQGLIPLQMEGRGAADPEEERRLLYVAMTRARERLFLTRSRRRRLFGRLIDTELSPFVKQIDTKLIERGQPVDTRRRQRQLSLF